MGGIGEEEVVGRGRYATGVKVTEAGKLQWNLEEKVKGLAKGDYDYYVVVVVVVW